MWWLLIVDRGPAGERHALDHVGIERALRQKLDRPLAVARDAARLGLERVDEELADRLALGLRIVEPLERLEEFVGRVDMDERDVEMAAEQAHHLLRLALAHEAVIDEDAGQLVADRLVDQHRRDRRIDAAREAADHARLADLRADARDLLGAEGGHRPVALEARDLVQEIGDELRPVGRMDHLGVEHGRVVAARFRRPRPHRARSPTRRRRGSRQAGGLPGRRGSSTPDSGRPFSQTPSNRAQVSRISTSARPNSAAWPPSTLPPSCWHSVCWP